MSGIYVVSNRRHAPTWRILRDAGLPILASWIDNPDVALHVEDMDTEMRQAAIVLFYQLDGEELGVAALEFGFAVGAKVPVFAVGRLPYLAALHPAVTSFPYLDAAVEAARAHLGLPAVVPEHA